MKSLKIIALFSLVVAMLVACVVPVSDPKPEDRGKLLFNDPKLGGGTSGSSCNSCHPKGKGLERIAGKKEWKTRTGDIKTVEEVTNICITMALRGTALDVNSQQMKDLVSYINTLKKKKRSKAAVGC
jgi:cytochrome c5